MCKIFNDLLSELVHERLSKLQNVPEYADCMKEISELSTQLQPILEKLSPEEAEIINAYIDENARLAEMDCKFLYIKGAIDSNKLLDWFEQL